MISMLEKKRSLLLSVDKVYSSPRHDHIISQSHFENQEEIREESVMVV